MTSKKTSSYEFGRHLVTSLLVFQGFYEGVQKFCLDFHRFCPNFKDFARIFGKSKFLGVRLHSGLLHQWA